MKAYEKGIYDWNHIPSYSRCHKAGRECNLEGRFDDDYTSIVCECDFSSWVLVKFPDEDNKYHSFDITSQFAHGEESDYGMGGPNIETDDEDDEDVYKQVAYEMVTEYDWPQSYYDQYTDIEED